MKLFLSNSLHHGDVLLTRVVIDAVRTKFPQAQIILECQPSRAYMWKDYGYQIKHVNYEHLVQTPTGNCPSDFVFVNLWFGVYHDLLVQFGLSHTTQVHTFNRRMHEHKTNNFLSLPTEYPGLQIPHCCNYRVPPRTVLVENGSVHSYQNNLDVNQYVSCLARDFPEAYFFCSAKPNCAFPNVIDGSRFNLLEISEISNQCVAFITKASGVNAATYTKENQRKKRFFFGWCYAYKMWEGSGIAIRSYDELVGQLKGAINEAL